MERVSEKTIAMNNKTINTIYLLLISIIVWTLLFPVNIVIAILNFSENFLKIFKNTLIFLCKEIRKTIIK